MKINTKTSNLRKKQSFVNQIKSLRRLDIPALESLKKELVVNLPKPTFSAHRIKGYPITPSFLSPFYYKLLLKTAIVSLAISRAIKQKRKKLITTENNETINSSKKTSVSEYFNSSLDLTIQQRRKANPEAINQLKVMINDIKSFAVEEQQVSGNKRAHQAGSTPNDRIVKARR